VLRAASEDGIAVELRGAGTKLNWGEPVQAGVVLGTERMNRVLDHTWQDMTCSVEAGCTWSAMQQALANYGQHVALDPLWPERATVGGIVATNDSGSLRLRYGGLRDLIIGMTVVLADGTVARSGGKVVKNVAGYDIHKLMTGAFGTLGVVTEVTFRLHSLPRQTRTLSVQTSDAEVLGRLLIRLLDSDLNLQAMQLRDEADGFALDMQMSAIAEALNVQEQTLRELTANFGLVAELAGPEVWQARAREFEHAESVVIKGTMLPTSIAGASAEIREMGGTSVTQAVGAMTAAVPTDAAAELLGLRRKLESSGGSLTVLRRREGDSTDRWGAERDTLPLMREIKRQFDPKRILNPGRFLGGI
jgi:glycolate oxidase FAD binding subunit